MNDTLYPRQGDTVFCASTGDNHDEKTHSYHR